MKQLPKYCHCLLFVTPAGLPITEYLPADHEGRTIYGLVLDPTPLQGREGGNSRAAFDSVSANNPWRLARAWTGPAGQP